MENYDLVTATAMALQAQRQQMLDEIGINEERLGRVERMNWSYVDRPIHIQTKEREIQIFRQAVEQEVQRLTLTDQMAPMGMHYDQVMNNINSYVIGMDPPTFNGSMGPYEKVEQDDDQIVF